MGGTKRRSTDAVDHASAAAGTGEVDGSGQAGNAEEACAVIEPDTESLSAEESDLQSWLNSPEVQSARLALLQQEAEQAAQVSATKH